MFIRSRDIITFLVWTTYIHLRNFIVFLVWTMYINLRNLIVFLFGRPFWSVENEIIRARELLDNAREMLNNNLQNSK